MKKIIILGAGGHAKVVADALSDDYELIGFLDKDDKYIGNKISGGVILGNDDNPSIWKEKGINRCVVGIGNMGDSDIRNKAYDKYKNAGFFMETIIHGTASVSKYSEIGCGTVVLSNAVINSDAQIGENCIINSSAVIEHDVKIGYGAHVGPGSVVLGMAEIGDNSLIGAGSVVLNKVKVGKNVIVGAGSVILKDIPDNVVVVGHPGEIIKHRR